MNLRNAAIGFVAVFGGFGLYAFASPPTFESTATVELRQSKAPARIEPLDAVLAFEASVLDAAFLERLRVEHAFSDARASVDVMTSDGRTYVLQCRANEGTRAQKLCVVVAARAHERAPSLASLLRESRSDDHKRVLASEALASFTRVTPEIITPTPSSSVAAQTAVEWRRLVGEATQLPAERSAPQGPPPEVRVIQAATLPESPIEPNRRIALSLGLAFGWLFAFLLGLGERRAPRSTSSEYPEISVHGVEWSELSDQLAPHASDAPAGHADLDPGFFTTRTVATSPLAAARVPNIPMPDGEAPAPVLSAETTRGFQGRTLVGVAVPASLTSTAGQTPVPPSDGAYRFADLESLTTSLEQRATRSTAIFGSPVAPQVAPSSDASSRNSSAPPSKPSSSFPPPRVSSSQPPPMSPPTSSRPPMEPAGARYSYVSSSPPKATGVSIVEPSSESKPHPSLRPGACKPLRRELYAFGVERCFVLGVSSVLEASERKSRFAAELALSLAETGHARVLLLDIDSAQSSVPASLLGLGMREHVSLAEQLERHATLGAEHHWEVVRVAKALHVLVGAGLPLAGPSVLAFHRCMQVLRSNYDFIVVHGPCLSDEAACELLAPHVDGVLAISFESDPSVRSALGPFLTKRLARVVLCSREVPVATS